MKRYVRNIAVDLIDFDGQEKLNNATALVVGAGGLGSHTLYHLASFGLKNLIIMDDDTVSISNLQRQIMFNESSVGKSKVREAANTINRYNSDIAVYPIEKRFTSMKELIDQGFDIDIIFDCTDNYQARLDISTQSQENGNIPVVFAAVSEFQGWVFPQFYGEPENKVFEDIFKEHKNDENCEALGVVSTSVAFVSSIQATEGLKYLIGMAESESTYLDINCFMYKVTPMVF